MAAPAPEPEMVFATRSGSVDFAALSKLNITALRRDCDVGSLQVSRGGRKGAHPLPQVRPLELTSPPPSTALPR